ncbi:hypothetical protein OPV22_003012 [Ensete ventricosum]|uniref:Uncharacterized protein n=1 Tax=Ensete ventricosum TaxID=4639 RepID=A0AAV8RZK6_ENSVE|nr:hypothetical protein OPV22_003012 [Ensete ventricosum]
MHHYHHDREDKKGEQQRCYWGTRYPIMSLAIYRSVWFSVSLVNWRNNLESGYMPREFIWLYETWGRTADESFREDLN